MLRTYIRADIHRRVPRRRKGKVHVGNGLCEEKSPALVGNMWGCSLMWGGTMNGQTDESPTGLQWAGLGVLGKHVLPSGRR